MADQVLADEKVFGRGTAGPPPPAGLEWLLADPEQSIRRVTDNNGAVLADFDYDSFGNFKAKAGQDPGQAGGR